jgi:integrase
MFPYGGFHRMPDLTRKSRRLDLVERPEPYWSKLGKGAYLGFRRGPNTWIARFRDRSGKQQYHALPVPLGSPDEYRDAKDLAEAWFAQMGGALAGSARRSTVRQALAAYVEDLDRHGRQEAAKTARPRFRVIIESDPIADLKLEDATQEDFLGWRDRLAKGRQPQTVNRYTGAVAAGLNRALKLGYVGDARAWTLDPLTSDAKHDEATAVFLTPAQRQNILANATSEAADFFRALELTGARPGEIARATVADFDGGQVRLTHRKGRPPRLRTRFTILSEEGVTFFRRMCRDKLPAARLFYRENGKPWTYQTWGESMRAAITSYHAKCLTKNRLPKGASAYSFRHSRISELLQLHGIDPLTVAVQTGTSLHQIEKTYYKFIPQALKAKLAAVKETA